MVDCDRRRRCTITNIYRPPIRRISGEDERRTVKVREWLRRREEELIMGDFNLHHERWGSEEDQGRDGREEAEEVIRWCAENGYGILNTGEKTCVDRRTGRWSVPDVSLAGGGGSEELLMEDARRTGIGPHPNSGGDDHKQGRKAGKEVHYVGMEKGQMGGVPAGTGGESGGNGRGGLVERKSGGDDEGDA